MNREVQLDPYEILQINYDDDISTIRNSFKILILENHPDKGGDPQNFYIIKEAYKYLYNKHKEDEKIQKQIQENQLRVEESQWSVGQRPTVGQHDQEYVDKKRTIDPTDFNISNFNVLFGKYRVDIPEDDGYGNEIETSVARREKVSELVNKKSEKKDFGKHQITIYEEPLGIESLKDNYKVLGQEHINNFGSQNNSSQKTRYTDYKKAYTEEEKITSDISNVRSKEYQNIDDLLTSRSRISYDLSPEDEMKVRLRKKEENRMEKRRQWQLSEDDNRVFDNYKNLQNRITLGR